MQIFLGLPKVSASRSLSLHNPHNSRLNQLQIKDRATEPTSRKQETINGRKGDIVKYDAKEKPTAMAEHVASGTMWRECDCALK
jgi:hypothetical protein